MANALWITLIGMGLVFLAIVLLWGLMALLVRVTAERPDAQPETARLEEAAAEPTTVPSDHRRRAAVTAVAVALALEKQHGSARKPVLGGADLGSNWQTVHRAAELNQRVNLNRNR